MFQTRHGASGTMVPNVLIDVSIAISVKPAPTPLLLALKLTPMTPRALLRFGLTNGARYG
ncbi:MAG: hypothetical protein ACOC07_11315 [Coleofasciculus sp.]